MISFELAPSQSGIDNTHVLSASNAPFHIQISLADSGERAMMPERARACSSIYLLFGHMPQRGHKGRRCRRLSPHELSR